MNLRKAEPDEHQQLKDICLEYVYEILPRDKVQADKLNELMDRYFKEKERHPYFIYHEGALCGFALVNSWCVIEEREPRLSIGEFYIRPTYRRQGLGTAAAHNLFDLHRGHWEIRQLADNVAGTAFWMRMIHDYTDGNFTSTSFSDERWKGTVQLFSNN